MNDWALYKLNDLINIYGSTLILIGSASSKTGFHLDWGSAKNWGVYLGSTSTQDPIAVWWLLHPTKLKDFLNIIKKVNLKGSAFSPSHDKLFEMQYHEAVNNDQPLKSRVNRYNVKLNH